MVLPTGKSFINNERHYYNTRSPPPAFWTFVQQLRNNVYTCAGVLFMQFCYTSAYFIPILGGMFVLNVSGPPRKRCYYIIILLLQAITVKYGITISCYDWNILLLCWRRGSGINIHIRERTLWFLFKYLI